MSQQNDCVVKEVKLGSSSKFETIIAIKQLRAPANGVEFRVDTLFGKAKNPLAPQTKAQFFLTQAELAELRDEISAFLSRTR